MVGLGGVAGGVAEGVPKGASSQTNVVSSVAMLTMTLKCSKCLVKVSPFFKGGPKGCPRGLLNSAIPLASQRQGSQLASGLTLKLTMYAQAMTRMQKSLVSWK